MANFKQILEKIKDKLLINYKKNKKVLIVFCIIWAVTIAVTLFFYSSSLGKQSWGNDWADGVVELDKNTIVEQRLSIINDKDINAFDSICLKFATYARKNKGNIKIVVNGYNTKTSYLDEVINVKDIIDNDYRVFKLNSSLTTTNDKEIVIKVTSDSEKGSGVGIYYSTTPELNGSFSINKEEQEYSLSTRLLSNSEKLNGFCTKTIVWMCVGFSLLILLFLLFEPKLEIFFPVLIFIFGLVFMAVIIPLSPPDEQYHYECSLQLSNKILGHVEDHKVVNKEYVNYSHFYGHYNISNGYIRFLRDINEPLDLSSHDFTITSDVDEVYSVYFIPQTVGITIARLLGVNMLRTFYAGRLTNLIFYCVCIYFVIKNTPSYKMLFGVIASMPIFIQTAASMSYDCYVIALSMLILSFFMKWKMCEDRIKPIDYVVTLLCCLGLANAKYVYSMLTLLFFLVSKDRFGSTSKKILFCLLLCAAGMYAFLPILMERITIIIKHLVINKVSFDLFLKKEMEYYNVISNETGFGTDNFQHFEMAYFYYEPLYTLRIYYRTIRYGIKSWLYNSIGRTLSGNTLVLPINFARAMTGLLFVTSIMEEQYVPSIFTKLSIVLVSAFIGLLILTGFFLTWTDVNQEIIKDYGGEIIQGVQGRYFSPLIPYFMTIFNNKKIKLPKKLDKYIIFGLILLTFEVIIYVLSYTFVN